MTNLPEGFWTPEKAIPLLGDATFQEPVKLMATGQIEAIDMLNGIQKAVAVRLGCISVDPETKAKHANVAIDGIRLWKMLMRPYDATCLTKPEHLFAEVDPSTSNHTEAHYTVPIANYEKRAKAVVATYDYYPRKPEQILEEEPLASRLGRKAIEKPHLGVNPFFVPPTPEPDANLQRFDPNTLFRNARNQGRAGGYRH